MRFRLIISKSDSHEDSFEKEFDQDVVKIGRLPENDVCLNDRFVSRNQAEIRVHEKEFRIVATTKSSFVYLNDVQLVNNQETVLNDHDELRLPGFSISFVILEDEPGEPCSPEEPVVVPERAVAPSPHETERTGKILAMKMRAVFSGSAGVSEAERKERLKKTVREFLAPYGHAVTSEDILASASVSFSAETRVPVEPARRKKESVALDAIESIAGTCGLETPFLSETGISEFSARVKSVLDIFIKNLFENVSMYREFQQEYDVEATRIYNWEKNPLKLAVSEESVKEYLFSQPKSSPGSVLENLDEVHRDIKLHQLGILKGFKKSLKELLNEMSPAVLASETGAGESDRNYKKIFEKLWTKDHTVLWNRYVEKYTDLCENETKTFNSIQKKFQNGYLSFLKRSKEK